MAFCLLIFGAMEMAMAVYAYNYVNFASSEGARYASMRGANYTTPATADSVRTYVRSLAAGLTRTNVVVNTTWSPNNSHGSNVKVEVSYQIVPLVRLALRQNLTVKSTSQAVINH
jgi:Flp pilus assembly protein TadG